MAGQPGSNSSTGPEAWSEPSSEASRGRAPRGLFRFDGLAVVTVVALVGAVLVRATGLLWQASDAYGWIEQSVLLALCTLAFFLAAKQRPTGELRSFFSRVAVAHLAWLIGLSLRLTPDGQLPLEVQVLVRDSFYALYYLVLLWAIEWAPGVPIKSRGERRLALAGSLILVVGSLAYFRILPLLAGREDAHSESLVYFAFDLYVAVRFLVLAFRNRESRISVVLGLLGISGLCLTGSEVLQIGENAGLVSIDESSLVSLWWIVSYIPLFLAARVQGLDTDRARVEMDTEGFLEKVSLLWSPLIAYGFALPAVHVILYSTRAGGGAVETARTFFVITWLVVVALLIFIQRQVIARRITTSQAALRESSDRIRALSSERESAIEAERGRLSRDLHDGLGQLLVALQMELRWLSAHNDDADPIVKERLETASERVRRALDSGRQVAAGLRPRVLDDLGLAAALIELVNSAPNPNGIELRSITDGADTGLAPQVETALYRIAQAALRDCLESAEGLRIEIELTTDPDRITLEVRDDGAAGTSSLQKDWASRGRLIARERAESVGGELETGIGIAGRGRSLRVVLPRVGVRPVLGTSEDGRARDSGGPGWRAL